MNFLDFIDAARKGHDEHKNINDQKPEIEREFNDTINNATADQLLQFFWQNKYKDITLDECQQMIDITKKKRVDFHQGMTKY